MFIRGSLLIFELVLVLISFEFWSSLLYLDINLFDRRFSNVSSTFLWVTFVLMISILDLLFQNFREVQRFYIFLMLTQLLCRYPGKHRQIQGCVIILHFFFKVL